MAGLVGWLDQESPEWDLDLELHLWAGEGLFSGNASCASVMHAAGYVHQESKQLLEVVVERDPGTGRRNLFKAPTNRGPGQTDNFEGSAE